MDWSRKIVMSCHLGWEDYLGYRRKVYTEVMLLVLVSGACCRLHVAYQLAGGDL